ncbi:MAG: DNA polymerase III subunit delta' [Chloroflexi bacterium]|nr:DNA polymerase III subunit delta' [Chloroflexota bacterium]
MVENWDILGHDWAVDLLKAHVRGGPRHAYLFTGPDGVGRRTLALRFAQALNAENPPAPGEFDPGSRDSRGIERMQHPDLLVMSTAEDAREIRIDQVRELGRGLALAPYMSLWKIALLLDFEKANENAQNALLKTLEEPPARVILLLTAESAEALLPTISSRCETLRLRPLGLAEAASGLERRGVPPERARLLAHLSGGRPGAALALHARPEALDERRAWLEGLAAALASGRVARFAYARELSQDKPALQAALDAWLSYWRDVMLRASGSAAALANLDHVDEIERLATRVGLAGARRAAAAIERTAGLLQRTNVNARLAAEALLLELPGV